MGAALRFYGLGTNSLWIDEFGTLSIASHSTADILRISSSSNFIPPLYFLLVHGVLQVFGESEVALRLASVVAGICTIPVVWLLTEQIATSRSTANIAGALLAVNPLHLWFSQEARPYALLLFFGCCALLSLKRAMRTQSLRYWIAFSVCSALAFLTHTTGLIFGVIAWTWALSSPDRPRVVRPLFAASLAVGLACAPFFVPIARALAATHGIYHSAPRSLTGLEVGYTLLTYVTGFSFGPAPRDIQNLGAPAALRDHPLQSAMAGAALLGVLVASVLKRRAAMTCFIALLGIPLAGIFALSALSGKAYNVRYTLPALIGFLGIVSIATRALAPRPRALALTALIGLALWADAQWFLVSRYWKEDSRSAVAWLRRKLPPGSTVAVAPGYQAGVLTYYAHRVGAELVFDSLPDAARSLGSTHPEALLVTRMHHLPHWRELVHSLDAGAGSPRHGVELVGYRAFLLPR
ncbi:MAG: glycosyltransferase family 39 protein [Gemmatimonadales bacterium]|nr:glycosyltransferase family 39 protein [Gemmatimonadales bacterium]